MSSTPTSSTGSDEISSRAQDAVWSAPRLMLVGAVALAIAVTIIILAAKIIGE